MREEQAELFRACFESFVSRDFDRAIRSMAELGMKSGFRRWPMILMVGPHQLQLWQIFLISQLRLGQVFEADSSIMMITIGHDAEVLRSTWFFQVLHMTLGKATVEEVLKLARDTVQECQTYYYYGERLLTERHKETAREYFQKALACEAQCQEKDFATARLEWLGSAP